MAKKGFGNLDVTRRRTHSAAAEAAKEAAAEAEYVRLNLEVPKTLRDAIQIQAIKEGLTMKELGTKVLNEYIERVNA